MDAFLVAASEQVEGAQRSPHDGAEAASAAGSGGTTASTDNSGGPGRLVAAVPSVARSDCIYTSCFCEENVYWLAKSLVQPGSKLFVVFVSNCFKAVFLWRQRAAESEQLPVVWDYHVFLMAQPGTGQPALVYDLDSTLPFPCLLSEYSRCCFLGQDRLPAQYRRCYRVVPAPLFLQHFASDRSHMCNETGWLKPQPTYPCIAAAADGATNTLPAYLEFPPEHLACSSSADVDWAHTGSADGGQQQQQQQQQYGTVLTEPAFLQLFGLHS